MPIILLREAKHKISYIDICNPIDVCDLHFDIQNYYLGERKNEKNRIKAISSYARDKMAMAVYYLMVRYMDMVERNDHKDIARYFIAGYINDTFAKQHWKHEVFEPEYPTKKLEVDREYEEVIQALSYLESILKNAGHGGLLCPAF